MYDGCSVRRQMSCSENTDSQERAVWRWGHDRNSSDIRFQCTLGNVVRCFDVARLSSFEDERIETEPPLDTVEKIRTRFLEGALIALMPAPTGKMSAVDPTFRTLARYE
jgi:hypothetical protein